MTRWPLMKRMRWSIRSIGMTDDSLSLIPRHVGVDVGGPGVNAAVEVLELLEAEALEDLDRLLAAGAVVAVDHDGVGGVQLIHAQVQLTERDELGSLDADDVVLVRLAHIEEDGVLVARQQRLGLFRLDVIGNRLSLP